MASTQKYLNHLLQRVGITPACSEEERSAAELVASIFKNHGFEPQMQEFAAPTSSKLIQAGLGIAVFIGALLMGFSGAVAIVGFLLVVAAAVIFVLEYLGRPVLSRFSGNGLSQNVIAYHKAEGPMASPRNRPVVVVAHYDSPRADLLAQLPFAPYRPLLVKTLPYATVAPAVIAVLNLLPFPGGFKIVLWLLALVCALISLAQAVAIIANRFVLPYTTGSVCNKSSVAALLGVMDTVAPFPGDDEFPQDIPFDAYIANQRELAARLVPVDQPVPDEAADDEEFGEGDAPEFEHEAPQEGSSEEYAVAPGETQSMEVNGTSELVDTPMDLPPEFEGDEFVEDDTNSTRSFEALDEDDPSDEEAGALDEQREPEEPSAPVNAAGNIRYGADVIRSLGMIPSSSKIEYEEEPADDLFAGPRASRDEESDVTPAAGGQDDEIVSDDLSVPASIAELASEPVDDGIEDSLVEIEEADDDGSDIAEADDEEIEDQGDADELDAAPTDPTPTPSPRTPEVDGAQDVPITDRSTQVFTMPDATDSGSTQVYQPVETVDSLMAQIDAQVPSRSGSSRDAAHPTPRQIPPVVPDASALQGRAAYGNHSSLFDVPDPSSTPADPFAAPTAPRPSETAAQRGFTVIGPNDPVPTHPVPSAENTPTAAEEDRVEEQPSKSANPLRGISRFFNRRKKKQQDSMSDWLCVDDDFDAKKNGGEIGSWDKFNFDDDSWKGGATGPEGVSDDELREAITSLGDDELLGHDIWFVATGASELDNAGVKAFLGAHRDKLRGVFLINLESIGAGSLSVVTDEGERRVLKGDKRIASLVNRVSQDFHHGFASARLPFMNTDAHAAMELSLRSLTIAGMDATCLACSHSEDDQPYNVDSDNVQIVSDVVTEVIRRS